ncbi:MAG: hypothetical protein JOY82_11295 [Streptosporangiaceae bacterium]|nr:hypothetical protein [Streptosporangiaceae bacterium]
MRNYRYKQQRGGLGVLAGITAQATRVSEQPATGEQVSKRVWLDASQVSEGFTGRQLRLSGDEIAWLRHGLGHVAHHIERPDQDEFVVIAVRTVDIVPIDYLGAALAPAIAGWAAEEFGFPPPQCLVRFDQPAQRYVAEWDR